jgi:phosphoribosylamine--glycine ligase
MGAYCDPRILTAGQTSTIMETVMSRAVAGMRREGNPFTGFLYAGLMLTSDGPKVLEFNVRMGDPETQAILHAANGDLLPFLQGDTSALTWTAPSVCVVLAAAGYPDKAQTGDPITGILNAEALGATVFQAGTANRNGALVTNGGRVLGVTAGEANLPQAIEKTYRAVDAVHFPGMQLRRDIAQKGLRRW